MMTFAAAPETAYLRKVLFAAEVIDAVTLARITQGLVLTASGIAAAPVLNWGGLFVWLDDGKPAAPHQITVDPGRLPYAGATVPAPVFPQQLVTIALAPGRGYQFQPGITALRFALVESAAGPRIPVPDAEVWLAWLGPGGAGTIWTNAPARSRTDRWGDVTAVLRLLGDEEPGRDAQGALRVRVKARRGASIKSFEVAPLVEGRVTDLRQLAWDEFQP